MANILCRRTAHIDKDPFAQSDRGGFGKTYGKGDAPRNLSRAFNERFPSSMGRRKASPGKKTYRYR